MLPHAMAVAAFARRGRAPHRVLDRDCALRYEFAMVAGTIAASRRFAPRRRAGAGA
jgi:hypothetical protein